jgi:LysR family glycine cleavage system transcriptional activator
MISISCLRISHGVKAVPRRLPQLNALKAFDAAARHESFTQAAEELCVTQGAVSHQVKALEAELGVRLFNRERQRLVITEAGREYLTVVRDAFDRIALGTERLVQRQNSGALTVSTSPDFAAKSHSEINLKIAAQMHHVDFAREDVDLAVRHGDGNWPGLAAVNLCPEELFVVCSPRLLTKSHEIREPSEVLRFPLLHLDDRSDWSKWLETIGVVGVEPTHGPVFNHVSMLIDAVIEGQGVALARTALAAFDLLSGRLVRPFPDGLPLSKTYWIVCPRATAMLPKIVTFRDWLLAEAADDLRRIKNLRFTDAACSNAASTALLVSRT